MLHGRGGERPDIWIAKRGRPATVEAIKMRYGYTTETVQRMLDGLTREGRLVRMEVGGVVMWDVPRRN